MRIIQVTPTPFGSPGLLGGGERYPLELARALARRVDCELISFGRERSRRKCQDSEVGLAVSESLW